MPALLLSVVAQRRIGVSRTDSREAFADRGTTDPNGVDDTRRKPMVILIPLLIWEQSSTALAEASDLRKAAPNAALGDLASESSSARLSRRG